MFESKKVHKVTFSTGIFLVMIFLSSLLIHTNHCWAKTGSQSLSGQEEIGLSLKQEARHSIDIALKWLKQKQNEDGSWSNPDYPALTALITLAFLRDPHSPLKHTQYPIFLQKALKFILGKVQSDGGIYTPGKGLSNYNTSICISALAATGNPAYNSVIQKARNYIISLQKDDGKKGIADTPNDGGIGYGTKAHSDMSNMYMALEALYVSKNLDTDQRADTLNSKKVEKKDLNWSAALRFIERCQNNPKSNDQAWASDDPDNYIVPEPMPAVFWPQRCNR